MKDRQHKTIHFFLVIIMTVLMLTIIFAVLGILIVSIMGIIMVFLVIYWAALLLMIVGFKNDNTETEGRKSNG